MVEHKLGHRDGREIPVGINLSPVKVLGGHIRTRLKDGHNAA
jgi:hypothetical protein